MKIKIKSNVVHKGKVLPKDSVHDLPARDASFLVDAGHATEATEKTPPTQQQQQQQQQPPAPPIVPPAGAADEKK